MALEFQPPSFRQPVQYPNPQQSLDDIFNQVLQTKIASQQIEQRQKEMNQAQAQASLQAISQGLPPDIYQHPELLQQGFGEFQNAQQTSQQQFNPQATPLASQASAPPQLSPLAQAIQAYGTRTRAMAAMGLQKEQAGIAESQGKAAQSQAEAERLQAITNRVNNFGQGQATNSGIPGIQQFTTPSGSQVNAQVNPNTGQIETNEAPGTKAPPKEVEDLQSLHQAQMLSDRLFNAYEKLAAKGKVGKVVGKWNEALGQFTGGAKDPDVLAFHNAAEGLIGQVKGAAGEPSRIPIQIIDRLQKLFVSPDIDPEAAKQIHSLVNQSIDDSITMKGASYPELGAMSQRIRKAIKPLPQVKQYTQTATNPKTGEKVGWNGTSWEKIQ